MAPVNGGLPAALRYALQVCSSVVFIPAGQPWRNGRLERFHLLLLREWLLGEQARPIGRFESGMIAYLNWFNPERLLHEYGCKRCLFPIYALMPCEFGHDVPVKERFDEADYEYRPRKRLKKPYMFEGLPAGDDAGAG